MKTNEIVGFFLFPIAVFELIMFYSALSASMVVGSTMLQFCIALIPSFIGYLLSGLVYGFILWKIWKRSLLSNRYLNWAHSAALGVGAGAAVGIINVLIFFGRNIGEDLSSVVKLVLYFVLWFSVPGGILAPWIFFRAYRGNSKNK